MKTLQKENMLLKIIKYAPSLFVFLLATISALYITIHYKSTLKQEYLNIEKNYLEINKNRIKSNVETVNRYINATLKNSQKELEEELHHKINVVYTTAFNIYEKKKDIASKEEIINDIKHAIETIRYENGMGYFSIHTIDGINILHPINKSFEGKSVLNRKDIYGNYPVQKAIDIAKQKGEGFFTWSYFKPNDRTKELKKFGIVKLFEPYNLLITTALFDEDFQANLQKKIYRTLKNLEYEDKRYIFILNNQGKVILTKDTIPNSEYEKSMLMEKFNSFVQSTEKSRFVDYAFNHFENNTIKKYSKISFIQKSDTLDWVIGNGFDLDQMNLLIEEEYKTLNEEFTEDFYMLTLSTIIITIILLLISFYISSIVKKMFYTYKKQLLQKEAEKTNNYFQTIVSLVDLIEKRDLYTAGHSRRVANYSVTIAKAMNFSFEDIQLLEQIGLLHDIGKIAIPDSILLKPGRLTEEEFHIIKSHASLGYDVIVQIPMFKKFANIILSHHERYDGSGYPNGLKGSEIPLLASVLSIADSFDAMTSTRIYNKTKTVEEALHELQKNAGILYHPKVADIAIEVLKDVDIKVSLQAKQLPSTPIEKERFSYFFKDPLTNFSNENYLDLLLKQDLHQYKCLNLILVHKFSSFNEKHGWQTGNKLLARIAKIIEENYTAEDICRFHGPNFVLLNSNHLELDLDILNKKLDTDEVHCEVHHFDIDTFTNIDMLQETLNK